MTIVVDASVVVAALVDTGADGTWAESILVAGDLVAPHLLPAEVANVLRRAVLSGDVPVDVAAMAHAELLELPILLFAYEPFAERVWALRATMSACDAWYVALAESLGVQMATLDIRLARSPNARCPFVMPDPPGAAPGEPAGI